MYFSALQSEFAVGSSTHRRTTRWLVYSKSLQSTGDCRKGREVRFGEVPLAPDIEQRLDSIEVEKESVAATAREECVIAALTILGLGPNETSASATIFFRPLRPIATPLPWPEIR